MDGIEIELPGGQVNTVVGVGDTVRRTVLGDRTVQQQFLRHLEAVGFEGAPRFLGHDEHGRETLTFLSSDLPHDADGFSDHQIVAAAQLLRRFHDASESFPPVRQSRAEVMCHNDWTPANTMFRGRVPYAMIDFDTATPGTRLWDVAYSVWTWLDLSDPAFSAADQLRRIDVFSRAYDHPSCTISHIAGYLPARQAGRARWARDRNMPDGAAWALKCLYWTIENITEHIHPTGLPDV